MQNIFLWQNNLLKFYLENNIEKAIEYGQELQDEIGDILLDVSQQDLKFSIATAHSLKCDDLDNAIKLYDECLFLRDEDQETINKYPQLTEMRGIISNNLGIAHFYKFIELSSTVNDPSQISQEKVEPIVKNLNMALKNLKQSVLYMEEIENRLKHLSSENNENSGESEVDILDLETKLLVEDFFKLDDYNLDREFKSYDMMKNAQNEQFLKHVFKNPPVILPLQNLGEIYYILQKPRPAMALLDISLKTYKAIDPENLLKYKNLVLLGAVLEQQHQTQTMQQIFKSIFNNLENQDPATCYEKVFALKTYGYLLAQQESTRLEGNDYIKQSQELQQLHPYWAERKMNLFVPVMTIDENSLLSM